MTEKDKPEARHDVSTDGSAGSVASEARTTASTLEEFLVSAYSGNLSRHVITAKLAAAISSKTALSEKTLEGLAPQLASDKGLFVSTELIFSLRRLRSWPALAGALRQFLAQALCKHPVFASSSELQAAIANLPDAPPTRAALRLVLQADSGKSMSSVTDASLSSAALNAASRQKAAAAFIAWLWETRDLTLDALIRDLYDVTWEKDLDRLKDDAAAHVRALTGKAGSAALGLVTRILRAETSVHQLAAETARRGEARTRVRNAELEKEASTLRENLRESASKLAILEREIAEMKERHAIAASHSMDDQVRLRGRIVRLLRQETQLLENGLHALRRSPPKIEVMEDHADRVVDALKEELALLEKGES
jgi:hypothetical protein